MMSSIITINIFNKSHDDVMPYLRPPTDGKLFKIIFLDQQITYSRKMFEVHSNPKCQSLFLEQKSALGDIDLNQCESLITLITRPITAEQVLNDLRIFMTTGFLQINKDNIAEKIEHTLYFSAFFGLTTVLKKIFQEVDPQIYSIPDPLAFWQILQIRETSSQTNKELDELRLKFLSNYLKFFVDQDYLYKQRGAFNLISTAEFSTLSSQLSYIYSRKEQNNYLKPKQCEDLIWLIECFNFIKEGNHQQTIHEDIKGIILRNISNLLDPNNLQAKVAFIESSIKDPAIKCEQYQEIIIASQINNDSYRLESEDHIDKLQGIVQNQEAKIQEKEEQNQKLQNNIVEQDATIQMLNAYNDQQKNEINKLAQEITQLRNSNTQLNEKIQISHFSDLIMEDNYPARDNFNHQKFDNYQIQIEKQYDYQEKQFDYQEKQYDYQEKHVTIGSIGQGNSQIFHHSSNLECQSVDFFTVQHGCNICKACFATVLMTYDSGFQMLYNYDELDAKKQDEYADILCQNPCFNPACNKLKLKKEDIKNYAIVMNK